MIHLCIHFVRAGHTIFTFFWRNENGVYEKEEIEAIDETQALIDYCDKKSEEGKGDEIAHSGIHRWIPELNIGPFMWIDGFLTIFILAYCSL